MDIHKDEDMESTLRKERVMGKVGRMSYAHPDSIMGQFVKKKNEMRHSDRGFHHSDIHKAAEELRMEHKGSHDPVYESSKKNK